MESSNFISYYYPGEAMYGLTQLYILNQNKSWLDAAEKIAHYVIEERDGGLTEEELYHDHWLMLGLNHLYRFRSDSLYINQIRRLAKANGASQSILYILILRDHTTILQDRFQLQHVLKVYVQLYYY